MDMKKMTETKRGRPEAEITEDTFGSGAAAAPSSKRTRTDNADLTGTAASGGTEVMPPSKVDLPGATRSVTDERGLPCLILPSSFSQPLKHSTLGRTTVELQLPDDIRQYGKFCGSAEGGWFFVSFDEPMDNTILYNIKSGKRIPLPTTLTTYFAYPVKLYVKVVAAAIRGSPDEEEPYMVGAVVSTVDDGEHNFSNIAYWCSTDSEWSHVPDQWQDVIYEDDEIRDVLFSEENFYFLTHTENIRLLKVTADSEGRVLVMADQIHLEKREGYTEEDDGKAQKYLLDAGDGILMVVKCQNSDKTTAMEVFRLHSDYTSEDFSYGDSDSDGWSDKPIKGEHDHYWQDQEFDMLQLYRHKLLFIGQAASRVFDSKGYDDEVRPRLFFLDDRSLKSGDGFKRDDMGIFVFPDGEIQEWPPASGAAITIRSDRFPPTWLIP